MPLTRFEPRLSEEKREWWLGREHLSEYDRWIAARMAPYLGDRVLEVGCSIGTMTQHLVGKELVVAVDISADNLAIARRRLDGTPKLVFREMDVTQPEFLRLATYEFDTAVCMNVLEHIADDGLLLRSMHDVLQRDGIMLLIVPAHKWLYGTLDQSVGHYRRYETNHLSELLRSSGFKVIYRRKMNCSGVVGWFVVGRILRRRLIPQESLRLFNRLSSLLMKVEEVFPPPFGLSLMYVCQKQTA